MAVFRWYEGNGGQGLPWGSNFVLKTQSATQLVLSSMYPPWADPIYTNSVVFTIAGGETYTNPSTGQTYYTAGTITSIQFLNSQSLKQGEITMLSVEAAHVLPLLFQRDYSSGFESVIIDFQDKFWQSTLVADTSGSTITGSNNSGSGYISHWGAFWKQSRDGDELDTTVGNDTVNAGGGSDYIYDRGGADIYNGGAGVLDYLSYRNNWTNPLGPKNGIVADLALGRITGSDRLVDRVSGIEAISGTIYNDVLLGNGANNFFFAHAGNDRIDGRGGFDFVNYYNSGIGGIVANLATGIIRDQTGGFDRLISIEGVVGSEYGDRFVDTSGNQKYEGLRGDDHFTLVGGSDIVIGGLGSDTFKFVGRGFGADRIKDFDAEEGDQIHFTGASSMAGLSITDNAFGDRVITLGQSTVILESRAGLVLTASDFIFA